MNLPVRKKIKKVLIIAVALAVVATVSYGLYLFYKPHRDINAAVIFEEISVAGLTMQFLDGPAKANAKYLSEDGNSKVLVVKGKVYSIGKNLKHDDVIVLKDDNSEAGVNCTFTTQQGRQIKEIKKGDIIKIKGAITSGNYYDSTLDLYSNATLVQCTIMK